MPEPQIRALPGRSRSPRALPKLDARYLTAQHPALRVPVTASLPLVAEAATSAAPNAFGLPPQTFTLGPYTWDVSRALALTAGRSVEHLPVDALAGLLALIHVDRSYLNQVDLTAPLLLAPLPEADWKVPIDGWHRIARAVRDGLATLPTVSLTATEARRCLLGPVLRIMTTAGARTEERVL